MIKKIISGHQEGADLAGIDAALFLNIATGGHVPKGAYNERGKINRITYTTYQETESTGYIQRTYLNVKDSTATLIFSKGGPTGGTLKTIEFCNELSKKYLYVDLNQLDTASILAWLKKTKPKILNVAGSRESKHPGIYKQVRHLLIELLIEHNKITI